MPKQLSLFDDETPEKDTTAQDKAKAKKSESEYFKDQRTPKSPLIARSELAKMKAMTGGAGAVEGAPSAELKSIMNPKAMKKGGKTMEHKHNVDHVKHHYDGAGHAHEQDKVAKHYGEHPHKMHHDHVKAMCGGGMSYGKKRAKD